MNDPDMEQDGELICHLAIEMATKLIGGVGAGSDKSSTEGLLQGGAAMTKTNVAKEHYMREGGRHNTISQQPISQQPISQQPISQQPTSQQPVSSQPTSQSAANQPTSQGQPRCNTVRSLR